MLAELIESSYKKNFEQKEFSLKRYFVKAKSLAGNHSVIKNALQVLENCGIEECLDRKKLISIYTNHSIEFSSKIIITFWWGGVSNLHQAPKFYTEDNLNKLSQISWPLEKDLNSLVLTSEKNEYDNRMQMLYYNFKANGNYKLFGIDKAFFTKVFQFYSQAFDKNKQRDYYPIIADQWIMKGILAEMISIGYDWGNVFRPPKLNKKGNVILNFTGSSNTEYFRYKEICQFLTSSRIKYTNEYPDLTEFKMEEIIFGWGADNANPNNPRVIAKKLIKGYFNIIDTKQH